MKSLLVYARGFFDPGSPKINWMSPAYLASSLYGMLAYYGEADYLDVHDSPAELPKDKEYDLVIYENHINAALYDAIRSRYRICFQTCAHPTAGRRANDVFNEKYHIVPVEISSNYTYNDEAIRYMAEADETWILGNGYRLNEYIDCGVPEERLFCFSYASPLPLHVRDKLPDEVPHVLYGGSWLGYRKGFDLMADVLFHSTRPFRLTILGYVIPEYREKQQSIKEALGDRCRCIGWMEAHDPQYAAYLDEADFHLFPTLSEGQVGTGLDCMARGVIPIYTKETGIDWSPFGFLEPTIGSEHNMQVLDDALSASPQARLALSRETSDFYRANHLGWEERVKGHLEDFLMQRCLL